MKASVVIITRNRSGSIHATLEALAKQSIPSIELVVVDSSSGAEQEATKKAVLHYGGNYIFEARLGQSRARNTGLENVSGEIIAFTDDDCIPEHDWLKNSLGNFSNPMVWACTGRVVQHSRSQTSDLFEEVAGQDLGEQQRIFSGDDLRFNLTVLLKNAAKIFSKHMKSKSPVPFGIGHGSSMAFRRSVFKALGGFDERFGSGAPLNGCEDLELFYRILKSNHLIIYEPSAIVSHNHSVGSAEDVFKVRYGYSHSGAALLREYRKDPLMFYMFYGRLLQLILKTIQYRLLRKKDLARSFWMDLRGFLDGWSAHSNLERPIPIQENNTRAV